MIKFCLAAATALTMMSGVALGHSSSPTTTSLHSSDFVTSERNTDPGKGVMGKFWTPAEVQLPASIDDVPKTVRFAPPVSETAFR